MSFSLATLASRRAARQERNRLRAELDAYSTHADRAELDLILSRHSASELDQLAAATGQTRWAA